MPHQTVHLEGHRQDVWNAAYALYKFEDMFERFGRQEAPSKESTALPQRKDVWIYPSDGTLKIILLGRISKYTKQCDPHEKMAEDMTAAGFNCELPKYRDSFSSGAKPPYRPQKSWEYTEETENNLQSLGWKDTRRRWDPQRSILTITLPDSQEAVDKLRARFMEVVPVIIAQRVQYWGATDAQQYENLANDLLKKYIDPNAPPFDLVQQLNKTKVADDLFKTLDEAAATGWLSTQPNRATRPAAPVEHQGTIHTRRRGTKSPD